MRSDAIVIVGVGLQDSTQMHLAKDNDVVHTLTPDRSDQCVAAPKIDPSYCLT
jgi:ketol-acid reductoisomerase